jgi:hypothetical protein
MADAFITFRELTTHESTNPLYTELPLQNEKCQQKIGIINIIFPKVLYNKLDNSPITSWKVGVSTNKHSAYTYVKRVARRYRFF